MKRNMVLVTVVLGLAASALWADIVHLKDGRKLEGKAVVEGDKVKVVTRMGTVTFPKDQVVRIEKTKTPVELYKEKAAAIKDDDAEAHWELAMWCKQKRLRREMADELKKVIAIDADHEKAHAELNHVKVDGKWVKVRKGMVYIDGAWVKPAEAVDHDPAFEFAVQRNICIRLRRDDMNLIAETHFL